MTEPDIDWQWCTEASMLTLQTRQGALVTALATDVLSGEPELAFTLQQAEWFWQCRHALESLGWPEQALLQACVDAVAQLSFSSDHGDKSFYLQPQAGVCASTEFSLVQLLGRNYALALVLQNAGNQQRLMLLSELDTLTGRTLTPGRTLLCRADRLTVWPAPTPRLAKTA